MVGVEDYRNEAAYWQQRTEDVMDLLFESIALMAGVCCEIRTELEILRAERSKDEAASAALTPDAGDESTCAPRSPRPRDG